jgi:hypothetical protein
MEERVSGSNAQRNPQLTTYICVTRVVQRTNTGPFELNATHKETLKLF